MALNKKLKQAYQDIERQVVKDGKLEKEVIDADTQKKIVNQVDEEYRLCYRHGDEKRKTNLKRLRLYNNQKKDDNAVGDPLMFTVFNTILASLYDDMLLQNWQGRSALNDDDMEDNLNVLSAYDYDLMRKAEMDYFWDWDACFFGRGLMLMLEFDRTQGYMAPVPELLDAATFLHDPNASSVNGYGAKRTGQMRFGGWPVGATYYDLKKKKGYFNLENLRKDKEVNSLLDEAAEQRDAAQNRTRFDVDEESLGKYNNYEFQLLNWVTHVKGKKYLVTLGNNRTSLVRMLDIDKFGDRWPLIDRSLYPMSNDWDGVSIPDITEDKQRARAVLMNIGLKSAKSEAMPQYLYDETRIKNKNDLNWKHDKFIGVDGRVDNAIQPVNKSTVHQYVNIIMDMLDQAVQRATATPEVQQGMPQDKDRTLGEINLVSSKVDTRYSMSAKIFGWSEAEFWRQWYRQYKLHFKDKIDEKVVRIKGPSTVWRPLKRENIIADIDPDVEIESKVISEAKRIRDQQSFSVFASVAIQNPENNRRFIERQLGKLNNLSKEYLDLMLPPTIDEMDAQDENKLLESDELPDIDPMEDHRTHIRIHEEANESPAQIAHIEGHKEMLMQQRNPQLAPLFQQPQQPGQEQPNQFEPVNDARSLGLPAPTPTQ